MTDQEIAKKYQMWKEALEERQANMGQKQVFDSMMVFIGEQQREKQELEAQVERHKKEKYKAMKRNQELEKTLKIYADENHYVTNIKGMEIEATAMIDKGEVARQTLEGKR